MELTVPALAKSCFQVFKKCLGLGNEWESLPDNVRIAWCKVANTANNIISQSDELNFVMLADALREKFLKERSMQSPRPLDTERLTWEAIARHAAMVSDADEEELNEETFPQAEASWGPWVLKELRRLKEARDGDEGQAGAAGRGEAEVGDAADRGGHDGDVAAG